MKRKINVEIQCDWYTYKREFEIEEAEIFSLAETLRSQKVYFKITMGSLGSHDDSLNIEYLSESQFLSAFDPAKQITSFIEWVKKSKICS